MERIPNSAMSPKSREDLGRGLPAAWIWPAPLTPRGEGKVIDFPAAPPERARLVRAATDARFALREAAFAAAEAASRARAVAEALDQALAALDAAERGATPRFAPVAGTRDGARLSPREREVLALLAEGRSNKSIAEALYVSPNTVKTHVASLLSKLHADTRVQLAAMAAKQSVM